MNPFIFGKPTSGKFFCKRPELEKTLEQKILSEDKVYLLGPSKIGKTSLVKQVSESLISTHYLIHIDLRLIESVADLERRIVTSLLDATSNYKDVVDVLKTYFKYSPQMKLDILSGEKIFTIPHRPQVSVKDVEEALKLIEPINNLKPILFLDNFQEFAKIPEYKDVLKPLMKVILKQKELSHVFAETLNVFDPREHLYPELEKSLEVIRVESIGEPEYRKFAEHHFAEKGVKVPELVISELIKKSGPITGNRQQAFNSLFEVLETDKNFDKNKVRQSLNNIFEKYSESYEIIFEDLTLVQKKILKELAANPDAKVYSKTFSDKVGPVAKNTVDKTLQTLIKKKLIYKAETHHQFANVFFREWIHHSFNSF